MMIILCRLIMPKGGLTHDQLSNVVAAYFAIALDITELNVFEIFNREDACSIDIYTVRLIVAVWAFSTLQFTFPLTVKGAMMQDRAKSQQCRWFYETEIWSLILCIILQDGPFLLVRLYCVLHYKQLKMYRFGILFYMGKNVFMIILQTYRAIAVLQARKDELQMFNDSNISLSSHVGSRRGRYVTEP